MNRRRPYVVTALVPALLILAVCANSVPQQEMAPAGTSSPASGGAATPEAAAALITPENVFSHISFLASDEMRGRDTPSPEIEITADYIEQHFQELGLEPAGEDGFIQRWPYHVQAVDGERAALELSGSEGSVRLAHGRDYFLAGTSADVIDAVPVFVGTAAAAAQGLGDEVRDQVAVVYLPGSPGGAWNQMVDGTLTAATDVGARSVIFALDPQVGQSIIEGGASFNTRPERDRTLGLDPPPPAYFVRYDRARELSRAAGQDLDALIEQANGAAQTAVPFTGSTVRLEAPVRIYEEAFPPNVAAVLRGSDPVLRDEYIVLSAHMDHVGVGAPDASGDTIYNGADDNASGTSAILEVARAFAALEEPPARSILFLAVSGEEKGLLGSLYFSERPTVPIESVVTNINMDMVGRNSPDSIVAIGKEWSSLGPLIDDIAREHSDLRLTVSPDLWPEQQLFFRSDQLNFVRHEIPALFLFSGLHEDYHRPSDTVEKIDTDKVARVARLAFYTAHQVAMRPEPPRWTEEGLAEVRALTARGR